LREPKRAAETVSLLGLADDETQTRTCNQNALLDARSATTSRVQIDKAGRNRQRPASRAHSRDAVLQKSPTGGASSIHGITKVSSATSYGDIRSWSGVVVTTLPSFVAPGLIVTSATQHPRTLTRTRMPHGNWNQRAAPACPCAPYAQWATVSSDSCVRVPMHPGSAR